MNMDREALWDLEPVTGLRGFETGCGFLWRFLARMVLGVREAGRHCLVVNAIEGRGHAPVCPRGPLQGI